MTIPPQNGAFPDEPGVPGATYGTPSLPHPGQPGQPAQSGQAAQTDDPWAGYEDYFGFEKRERWYFPDGKQWIEFRKLTEGDRAKYLRATRSDVHLNQQTKEARVAFDQSQDRKQLLLHSITNWHIVMFHSQPGGRRVPTLVPFPSEKVHSPGGELAKWIDRQDPDLLAGLEKRIRMVNPWLMSDMSAEQIRKEMADLAELLKVAEEREAREATFPSAG